MQPNARAPRVCAVIRLVLVATLMCPERPVPGWGGTAWSPESGTYSAPEAPKCDAAHLRQCVANLARECVLFLAEHDPADTGCSVISSNGVLVVACPIPDGAQVYSKEGSP
jgi:hypothetical protein